MHNGAGLQRGKHLGGISCISFGKVKCIAQRTERGKQRSCATSWCTGPSCLKGIQPFGYCFAQVRNSTHANTCRCIKGGYRIQGLNNGCLEATAVNERVRVQRHQRGSVSAVHLECCLTSALRMRVLSITTRIDEYVHAPNSTASVPDNNHPSSLPETMQRCLVRPEDGEAAGLQGKGGVCDDPACRSSLEQERPSAKRHDKSSNNLTR